MTDAPAPPSPRALSCPNCGGAIKLRAEGVTVTAICSQCSSIIDTTNADRRVIQKASDAIYATVLEIGDRGILMGTLWEVIGHMQKAVENTDYRWAEYLLYNPWQGFRFLSNVNGHWTIFKRLNLAMPGAGSANQATYQNKLYRVFNKDNVVVERVKGEFYWRVKRGDTAFAADYIRPPYMLSVEIVADEINLSHGEYVPVADMRKAFPKAQILQPSGVGACQQTSANMKAGNVVRIGALSAFAAIVLHSCISSSLPHGTALTLSGYATPAPAAAGGKPLAATHPATVAQPFSPYGSASAIGPDNITPATGAWGSNDSAPTDAESKTLTSQPFDVPDDGSLDIATETRLDNAWADFDYTLVNETRDLTFPVHQSLEHYSGIDDGERWEEGSNTTSDFLQRIPKGRYHMLIDVDSDALKANGQLPYQIEVKRGATDLANIVVIFMLLLAWPVWAALRHWFYESARWSQSDYTASSALKTDDS